MTLSSCEADISMRTRHNEKYARNSIFSIFIALTREKFFSNEKLIELMKKLICVMHIQKKTKQFSHFNRKIELNKVIQ